MSDFNLPEAFREKMKSLLPDEWDSFEYSYEHNKYQALRFNQVKKGLDCNRYDEILKNLDIKENEQVPWAEYGYYYDEEARPGKHPYHEMGLYYIQEPSAMSAAALLKPNPGERVLDLCAAPGGKTTQLASYMLGEGLLISNEIHPTRAKILSQNVERMGIRNAIVLNEESGALAERFPEFFHKIQVDAPCSGEGMFRKNPQALEEWSTSQVLVCAKRQLEILDNAAIMLLPGGTIVYSTCTFSKEENEDVIEEFLKLHVDFELEKSVRLWPHKVKGEGHFAAVLKRKGTLPEVHLNTENKSGKSNKKDKNAKNNELTDKKKIQVLQDFVKKTLKDEIAEYILSGPLVLFGEQLYRVPDVNVDLRGIKVLRCGLHIGEFKKERFEPSHALALAMGMEDAKSAVNISTEDERCDKYFRGEQIEQEGASGWTLVCFDGYSAGWGKASGSTIKNHYPKGIRKTGN